MLSIKIDPELQALIEGFAKENNITTDELIETILYDFVDENKVTLTSENEEIEESDYNEADTNYLKNLFKM